MRPQSSWLLVLACLLMTTAAACSDSSQAPQPDSGPAPVLDAGAADFSDSQPPDAGTPDAAPTAMKAAIDELAKPLLEDQWTVGLVVGVTSAEGTEVYGYGTTKAGGSEVPDGQTLFEIGSISKTFTSLLLAQMVEDKTLTLDQPVQDLLPSGEVTVPSKNGKAITLKHLSTHTSGLPRMPTNFDPADPSNPYLDYRVADLYAFLNGHTLAVEPGSSWQYSNLGAGLLGHALSLKAGVPYAQMVQSRIAAPLGLVDTAISLSADQAARLAGGHNDDLQPTSGWDFEVLAPCGALRSTAEDQLRYLGAQAGREQTALTSAMDLTHGSQFKISSEFEMGLGWLVLDSRYIFHDGGTGGYRSFAGFDVKTKNLVVILSNTATLQSPPSLMGPALLKIMAGETPKPLDLPPTLKLSPSELDALCGSYALDIQPSYLLTISRQADALYVTLPNQPSYRIWAQSPEKFYSRLAAFWLTFQKGSSGSYDSILFEQDGVASHTYNRVP